MAVADIAAVCLPERASACAGLLRASVYAARASMLGCNDAALNAASAARIGSNSPLFVFQR
eukprot:1022908-Rhodomonas_salina.2